MIDFPIKETSHADMAKTPWLIGISIVGLCAATAISIIALTGGFSEESSNSESLNQPIKSVETFEKKKVAESLKSRRKNLDTALWDKFSKAPDHSPWPSSAEWKVEDTKDDSGNPAVRFSRTLPLDGDAILIKDLSGVVLMDANPGPLSTVSATEPLMLGGKPIASLMVVELRETDSSGTKTIWAVGPDGRRWSDAEIAAIKRTGTTRSSSGKHLSLECHFKFKEDITIKPCGVIDSTTSETQKTFFGYSKSIPMEESLLVSIKEPKPPMDLLIQAFGGTKEIKTLSGIPGEEIQLLGTQCKTLYIAPKGFSRGVGTIKDNQKIMVMTLSPNGHAGSLLTSIPDGFSPHRICGGLDLNPFKEFIITQKGPMTFSVYPDSARIRFKLPPLPQIVFSDKK